MSTPTDKNWPGGVAAITLFVSDLDVSRSYYSRAFGLPVFYEDDDSAVFDLGGTLLNLLISSEAPELVSPAEVGDNASGARCQFTISVDDVDARVAQLASAGIALLNGPMDRPWGVRTAAFADPDGHIWEIAR